MKKSTITIVILLLITALNSSLFAQRFAPAIDTYIDKTTANVDKSYGTSPNFLVRNTSTTERITFLEFNIGDFSEQVSKAELCLYLSSVTNTGTEIVDVYEVTSGTIANDITWTGFNAAYTLAANPITSLSIANTATGWNKFDIKDLVNTVALTSGSNKKIKIALKARNTVLLLYFYSKEYTYPHYAPTLIMTPAMPSSLTEKSRTTVLQDGYVQSASPDTPIDFQYAYTSYAAGSPKAYRWANFRFNVPTATLNDNSRITVKTKVRSDSPGTNLNYVVDLYGIDNLSDATNVNNLTWNTMPTSGNYTYLRSRFFNTTDKANETDVEWDITNYAKAAQSGGKSYINLSIQTAELGGAGGDAISFYTRNYLSTYPTSTNIPQLIHYQSPSVATLTTQAVSNIATTTAIGNGTITNLGEPNPTQYGCCWSTSQNPTTSNSKTQKGAVSSLGIFTTTLNYLNGNTIYYVKSYAANTSGTNYGNEVSFLTLPAIPNSVAATSISNNGFVANWTAPTQGSETFTYSLEYSPNNTFTTGVTSVNLIASNLLAYTITGLTPNTNYYYRIKAVNASGSGSWSEIQTVKTLTITWTGTGSWSTSGNWSSGSVPATDLDVIVQNGELTIDQSATVQSLTINPGAKLTISAGQTFSATNGITLESTAGGGTATLVDETAGNGQTLTGSVQQYLATTRNWYVSSPVSNANAPAGYSYYRRNEPAVGWTAVSSGAGLVAGVGYIALPISTGPITFTTQAGGKINTGIIAIPLTWQGASNKGYNLIGNPYPSHLTWNKAFTDTVASKIEPTIWYRTNSGGTNSAGWSFKTFNAFTGVGVPEGTTGIIPPMQAFWVLAKVDGQSIYFKNSMRSHQSSNPLKAPAAQKSENKLIRLQVSNGTASDETVLLFNNNAVDGYDNYDSPKMLNNSNDMPDIYTLADAKKLVINGMSEAKYNSEILLGLNAIRTNTFSISANEISNFEAGTRLILRDKLLSKEVELNNGTQYSFTSEAASTENRFSVLVKAPSITTNLINHNDVGISVYSINNRIVVNCLDVLTEDNLVTVHTIVGSRLFAEKINSSYTKLNTIFASGIYLVTVKNGAKSSTKRIVIQN
jgi:hypothetical protein